MQAWDGVGQPAVEMAKYCGRAERLNRTEGFVALAMAVASAIKAYQKKHYLRLWTLFHPHPFFWRLGGFVEFSYTGHCSPSVQPQAKVSNPHKHPS